MVGAGSGTSEMNRINFGAAAIFLLFAVHAAAGENLSAAILNCSAQTDERAQLACYNQIAARLKTEAAPSAVQKPAPETAHPRADFGEDSIPFQAHRAETPDQITAGVTKASFNFFHRFTVTLDNGQIWRQDDSDTAIARFDKNKPQIVTIKRGFLGSFRLTIQDEWGTFSVKRIR
jgi:hypothetical protein